MLLGVHWFSGFPDQLYKFRYFKFKPGVGGHANMPAEIEANVVVQNPAHIIEIIEKFGNHYAKSRIYMHREGNRLCIGVGGYMLTDYDFGTVKWLENLVNSDKTLENNEAMDKSRLIIVNEKTAYSNSGDFPCAKNLHTVVSNGAKHNCEVLCLRLDCHLPFYNKEEFIRTLKISALTHDIHAMYYHEREFGDACNLSVYLTNGRQGLRQKPYLIADVHGFEIAIGPILQSYEVKAHHAGGAGNYPDGEAFPVMMVDGDFILG